MNMVISNGNFNPQIQRQINTANLARSNAVPAVPAVAPVQSAPSALNAAIISRIHNVRPGCGSCGRH